MEPFLLPGSVESYHHRMPFFGHLILRIAAAAGDFLDPASGSTAMAYGGGKQKA